MKKYLLLLTLAISVMMFGMQAYSQDKSKTKDSVLHKSLLVESVPPGTGSTFPQPFLYGSSSNPITSPAVSTGYYFVDSNDPASSYWTPTPNIVDTLTLPNQWHRIDQGPRIKGAAYWSDTARSLDGLGQRFFRNPALPTPDGNFFNENPLYGTDSTDDAIAGPIPIGFPFYFNGLRYDSFYVSTNGIMALTNRRYIYDDSSHRSLASGATCYDPQSMDWFDGNRTRYGNGMTDPTVDNYGYDYTVLGHVRATATAGIRQRGGSLNSLPYKTAVIAPFFGDLELSQFSSTSNRPDDFGKCYFYRDLTNTKLIVYFVQINIIRSVTIKYGMSENVGLDKRPADYDYAGASAQVVLDRMDSSVTFVYEDFTGGCGSGSYYEKAAWVFRVNTTAGVRGFARHVNYAYKTLDTTNQYYPWAPVGDNGEYEQYTHCWNKVSYNYADGISEPNTYMAIKFKQWKNSIRVVSIEYRVRSTSSTADLTFSQTVASTAVDNYELLAGESRIGAIQPVAVLENLTNNIQGPNGVNYQEQQLNFRARFRIVNLATNRIIYNRLVPIDSTCLAISDANTGQCTGDDYVRVRWVGSLASGDYTTFPFPGANKYNGIPPYNYVKIWFPPFEPNEYVVNHIGRLKAYIIGDPTDPASGQGYSDAWPFDDTTSVRLFVMKRLYPSSSIGFDDDVTEFHVIEGIAMPSVLKWVNIDADVVPGDNVSANPVPPRGSYRSGHGYDANSGVDTTMILASPCIHMNRLQIDGYSEPLKNPGGDEIRSYPIDMRNRFNSTLSMSIQRVTLSSDWPRGWSDNSFIGVEPLAFINANYYTLMNTISNIVSYNPDYIAIELAKPSPDGITGICNLPDASESSTNWRFHLRRGGATTVTDVPAYALFGGGGYQLGFWESDIDSALSAPSYALGQLNSMRPNLFDDGIDNEYQKAMIIIPDTFISAPKEGAKNFRFRVKVYARKFAPNIVQDDADDFYVDNVKILFPGEVADIEVSTVRADWPYTEAPASQYTKVPLYVKVSNNTAIEAPTFWIQLRIYQKGAKDPVYCQEHPMPFLKPRATTEVAMPNWNARLCPPGDYMLKANIVVPGGGDLEPLNDTNYSYFTVKYAGDFAYEKNAANPKNDVPNQQFANTAGEGLNLYGYATGGNGSCYGSAGDYVSTYAYGSHPANGSGQIAVKFQLLQADTIKGYKAYYGTLSEATDDIKLRIYTDAGGYPGQEVANSVIIKERGWDDIRKSDYWDQYVTYLSAKPLTLDAGTYWASVAQLGETGLELGASMTRSGQRTISVYFTPPITTTYPMGASGYSLNLDKNFRKINKSGFAVNNNYFAFENTIGSGNWNQFTPGMGNTGYAHLDHLGRLSDGSYSLSRGSWIPLLRPYLGERSYGTKVVYEYCASDVPVELTNFFGKVRKNDIAILWETASETNNSRFNVERREASNNNSDWQAIGTVAGHGTTTSPKSYSYFDNQVVSNTTYQYRLRQIDLDGSQSCDDFSKIITLTYTANGTIVLNPCSPNPVKESTKLSFTLPNRGEVKFDIIDVYGNTVKVLYNTELEAGPHSIYWDGNYDNGTLAPNGTYIYRLTVGDDVFTDKMTIVR